MMFITKKGVKKLIDAEIKRHIGSYYHNYTQRDTDGRWKGEIDTTELLNLTLSHLGLKLIENPERYKLKKKCQKTS